MKKKLLVLVAMLLCVVTVLASCNAPMKFGKVVGDGTYTDENPTLTAAAKTDIKGEIDTYKGDLVVFEDISVDTGLATITIYNIATGTVVWTGTESKSESGANTTKVSYDVELYEYDEVYWFKVTTATTTETEDDIDTTRSYSLRDAKGAEFAKSDKKTANVETLLDLIRFDGKVYRIAEDGSIAHAFDISDFTALPEVDTKVGENYYDESADRDAITIYNANLQLVTYYAVPSFAQGLIHILNNGNVLVQYQMVEPIGSEDYDVTEEGMGFTYVSELINAENGKVSTPNLDHGVMTVLRQSDSDLWIFNEKVENLAVVAYIEDQRVNSNEVACKLVSLGNNGKVKGEVKLIDNQAPELPKLVANNRWIVSDLAGNQFLLNEKGDVMANVTALESYNASFILFNNKIYDWDLNEKYDLLENDAEVVRTLDHALLMTNEDGETLLYTGGSVTTLINKDNKDKQTIVPIMVDGQAATSAFLLRKVGDDAKVTYDICNDAGTVLLTVSDTVFVGAVAVSAGSSNAILLCGAHTPAEGDEVLVYYRVG